ncbi:hypothetical protein QE152_g1327 [Popillia japonica]|uniref:Uncharacterized protein n=1 Tax=Popillia japonica TaxID=7064 RepID=A0AAW1N7S7_POPJA
MSSEETHCEGVLTKKRTKTGRMQEVMKKMKLSSHEAVLFHSWLFKGGEIAILRKRRHIMRNRNPEEEAAYHDSTYSYRVRIKRDNKVVEIPVCYKAFLSIHGVTKGKVEYLQKSLKETGLAPKDKRGKHCALTNKLPDDSYKKVYDHINSFKGRLSHYSLHDSKKLYLPEELNAGCPTTVYMTLKSYTYPKS